MDDPWYLPPDSPIPATIHVDGRQIRTISKASTACLLLYR